MLTLREWRTVIKLPLTVGITTTLVMVIGDSTAQVCAATSALVGASMNAVNAVLEYIGRERFGYLSVTGWVLITQACAIATANVIGRV